MIPPSITPPASLMIRAPAILPLPLLLAPFGAPFGAPAGAGGGGAGGGGGGGLITHIIKPPEGSHADASSGKQIPKKATTATITTIIFFIFFSL